MQKKKTNEAKGLITKCQMINLKKKSIFNKGLPCWKTTTKINKVKYLTVKQFKTYRIQTKHGIKNERK
jgi:hypothetical protein